MATQPDTEQQTPLTQEEEWMLLAPDISDLEIEDDEPLDNIASEKQKRLLTEPLYSSLKPKQQIYSRIGCWYYIIFDPSCFLKGESLQIFELQRRHYVARTEHWLAEIGLGLTLWRGTYEGLEMEWLR